MDKSDKALKLAYNNFKKDLPKLLPLHFALTVKNNPQIKLDHKEIMKRFKSMEKETGQGVKINTPKRQKIAVINKVRYFLNHAVLKTIQLVVKNHPNITSGQLNKLFPVKVSPALIRSVRQISDRKRWFTKPDQILNLKDGKFVVTTQMTIELFKDFIKMARKSGVQIYVK